MQNFVEIHQHLLKIFSRNKILTPRTVTVTNLLKLTGNNPNLDLADSNADAKPCRNPSIYSQDIGKKQNFDIKGHNCYKFAEIDWQQSQP